MEYRKIIKFGNSSHVVSLPNSWLKRNNLNKGDTIFFEENGNDELVFYSKPSEKKEIIKEVTINATNKSINHLNRELITLYINNYNLIKINDKNIAKRSKEIRNIIHGLVGLEIIEQTNNTLIAKDFLNVVEIPLQNAIRRTDTIIRSMLKNSKDCFKKNNCISIDNNDVDVNRLYFVVGRITKNVIENPQAIKDLKSTYKELLNIWLLMNNLEDFADECKRVSRRFTELRKNNIKKETIQKLKDVYDEIESTYIISMTAFYNKDPQLAFDLLEGRKDFIKDINDLLENDTNYLTVRIIEKFKNMVSGIKRITRIALDNSMD